ncbi:UTRA domain-containing protein [Salinispora arenicola]|uniref:UTRA domain-containing protein n=1 Tax=Salinispora arenicola TaxID=168697 RepID=UPI0027DBF096|nr:UTRA domain-containing protein [Salinispora arenicola]
MSPERQLQGPEETFRNESDASVEVFRESRQFSATEDLAEAFDLSPGDPLTHVVTRASDMGQPISISDTYQPPEVLDISRAVFLEETVADRLPAGNALGVASYDTWRTSEASAPTVHRCRRPFDHVVGCVLPTGSLRQFHVPHEA